jgi:hypothetical protein
MGFYLLDRRNPYGDHFYPTRNKPLLAIVGHITAGLEDLDTVDDHSAENTAAYAGNTDRDVSWHSGSDTDSWVNLLPATYTAWHVVNYNSCTYGHEISKKHTDWRVMSPDWVTKTLRNAAVGPDGSGGLRKVALENRIPLRKATRAELDREIANFNAGRPWTPVGFISHAELQPADRTDPGLVGRIDTFPWDRFFAFMTGPTSAKRVLEDDAMLIRNLKTGETAVLSGGVLTGVSSTNANATNQAAGGGLMLGVDPPVWDDMIRKSRVIETLGQKLDTIAGGITALAPKPTTPTT